MMGLYEFFLFFLTDAGLFLVGHHSFKRNFLLDYRHMYTSKPKASNNVQHVAVAFRQQLGNLSNHVFVMRLCW